MAMFTSDSRQFKFDVLTEICRQSFEGELKEEKVQGSKPKPQKPASGRGLGDTFDAYEEYRRYEQLRHDHFMKPGKRERYEMLKEELGRYCSADTKKA